ncbi:efflux transporter periplasmic adaptor subunit [Phaeobacter gallaeciensis]|uniref:Efflux transporter periplasmic adaptor subunit n=2 Tax=Roseobacteraceae TaxID=2854170 RepID=A0A366WMC2_9RHOB|nr:MULTISPECIES: HlyD family efflux transporter periplasmic adaptor subunit [Roseobacteraceae]MBT3141442.1 HlyD family efflux transporter periplasmic adaptor subunit [Falsiruegeria litorea]MBT8167416.1 HlyD family efflux transporter periplasmic adaptor subunit [Falsiruegeria litorea]RBW50984.1 efflux transporter periplasmic adaptor subunit [Phaeobacter gallaeciensis]
MRFLRQSLVGVFLASLTLALLIYAGQLVLGAVQTRLADEKRAPQARERIFAVNVLTAELATITPILEAFGQVSSRRTLELRAAAGGRIIALAETFEEGGSVKEGDVLVRIDPADAQSALDRANSDFLDAKAEERDAGRALILAGDELQAAVDQSDLRARALKRQIDLQDRGVGTAAAAETAELALASARQAVLARRIAVAQAESRVDQTITRLARAQIALDAAERDVQETTVTAGFSGTLGSVNLVEGRLVSANEKLAELVDPMSLEVAFRVSTAQYARLLDETGQLIPAPVIVALDVTGADLRATGVISRDAAAAGDGQSGRLIFARLSDAPGFKPGDFVTVLVDEPPLSGVVRLPASSLDATHSVLILGEEERLESLNVELVRRQGDEVLLRGVGLAGREVIVGRTPLLGAGIRVRPLRDGPQTQAQPEAAMLELTDERRAKLVAFVEGNKKMPEAMKARVLEKLTEAKVPMKLVKRIESRMGG